MRIFLVQLLKQKVIAAAGSVLVNVGTADDIGENLQEFLGWTESGNALCKVHAALEFYHVAELADHRTGDDWQLRFGVEVTHKMKCLLLGKISKIMGVIYMTAQIVFAVSFIKA